MPSKASPPPHAADPPAGGYRSCDIEIRGREDFTDATFALTLAHPMMARAARPGQFVIVMPTATGERIPLTIADFDPDRGTVTLVIQAVGKTTREMQRTCRPGTTLFSVAGPMGEPSRIGGVGKVVCIGGGLGVAPVFPQARAFREAGAHVIGIVGFRSAGQAFWTERFESACNEFVLCTDDGSAGIRGLVTDGLDRVIARHPDIREVVAIGPPLMMRACAERTRPHGIRTTVSLNPIMVDGTGMCGGCRVRLRDGMKFACVDGPDFDGHEVDFDDLVNRLNRFHREERQAVVKWSESCKAKLES